MQTKKLSFILTLLVIGFSLLYLFYGINFNSLNFFLGRRIPNLLAMLITGTAIALSSMIFQALINNRILTPSVLGLDALYMLLQTTIVFILGPYARGVIGSELNFVLSGGLMIVFSMLLFRLMFKVSNHLMMLLMVGIILSSLFNAISSFLQMIIDPNEFFIVQNRMFASFSNVQTNLLFLSFISVLACIIWTYPELKKLDVLSLGKDHAINLGIDYQKTLNKLFVVIAVLVATSTALVGPITFLGLLVINLTFQLFKVHQHKILIPACMLISIFALLVGQFLVERVFGFSTSISVLINFIGGLYFIYIILKEVRL